MQGAGGLASDLKENRGVFYDLNTRVDTVMHNSIPFWHIICLIGQLCSILDRSVNA